MRALHAPVSVLYLYGLCGYEPYDIMQQVSGLLRHLSGSTAHELTRSPPNENPGRRMMLLYCRLCHVEVFKKPA